MAHNAKFIKTLAQHIPPDASLTTQESAEAFYNLAGFMGVLFRINERTGLIAQDGSIKGAHHADQ